MTHYVVGMKGGKGGGSSRTPNEAPNSLRSNTMAKIIDIIGEGPIEGFVGDLEGVYFDKTPVKNSDGTFNFNGCDIQVRYGTPDQDPVTGFEASEDDISVGAEVTKKTPIVRTITNLDATMGRVTMTFPAMVATNTKNGDTSETTVEFAIDVQPSGGQFTEISHITLTGKNTSPTQKTYSFKLTGEGPWNVRVRRITEDSTSNYLNNKTTFFSLTEVIEGRFTYPNLAYVAIRAIADQFGSSIPDRTYLIKGLIINVPSNYDPISRTYTGIWDGTFKKAWTDNPAWCFYDMATNRRYGMKRTLINKWQLYVIGRMCDEMVDDGMGGKEPRFTLNLCINTQTDAIKLMDQLASVFRGMVYWGSTRDGSTMMFTQDVPRTEDGYKFFGPSNTIGDFTTAGVRLTNIHTVANVTYMNRNEHYDKAVTQVKLPEAIREFGYNPIDIEAIGVTSEGQAQRVGLWALITEYTERETGEGRVGRDYASSLSIDEVVRWAIPRRQGDRLTGRLPKSGDVGDNWVMLDAAPEDTTPNKWDISISMPNGEIFFSKVASFVDNTAVISNPLPMKPDPYASWALSSESLKQSLWRVRGIKDNEDGTYTVSVVSHNKSKYAAVDSGAELEQEPTYGLPTGPLAPPSNLTLVPHSYLAGDTLHQSITVGWTNSNDVRAVEYIIEAIPPDGHAWITMGKARVAPFEIPSEAIGKWQVRIAAVSNLNLFSSWVTTDQVVQSYLTPLAPTEVSFTPANFSITVKAQNPDRVGQQYEFWRSSTALESNSAIIVNSVRVGQGSTVTDNNLDPGTTYYYYVRGINSYGVSEFVPAQARTTFDAENVVKVLHEQLGQSELSKELSTKIDTSVHRLDDHDNKFDNASVQFEDVRKNIHNLETGLHEESETRKGAFDAYAKKTDEAIAKTDANWLAAVQKESEARSNADESAAKSTERLVTSKDEKNRADWGAAVQKQSETQSSALGSFAKYAEDLIATKDSSNRSDWHAAVQKESEARVSAVDSSVKTMENLVATTDGKNRADWGSAIQRESTARSDAISSQAKATESLIANAVSDSKKEMQSAVNSEQQARANADNALASDQNNLRARLDSAVANINSLSNAQADTNSAVATLRDEVAVKMGNQIAAVKQETSASINSLTNEVKSQWVLKLDNNGTVAGVGLAMNGNVSDFAVSADRFYVTNPSTGNKSPVFSVVNGNVNINSAVIGSLKLGRGNITDYLNSDGWWYHNEQSFGGLELNFRDGTLHCSNATISGDLRAKSFYSFSQDGNWTCELTGKGIVIKENGQLAIRLGIGW